MYHWDDIEDWPYKKMDFATILRKANKDNLKKLKIAYLDTGCDTDIEFLRNFSLKKVQIDSISSNCDYEGHGTFFASILAQYVHFKGIYPEVISVKIGDSSNIPIENINNGLKLCIEEDVDIINISACNTSFNEEMAALINTLAENNKLIFAPVGNNIMNVKTYPSCLNTVISCGMLDEFNKISEISNNTNVDIFIPSTNIAGMLNYNLIKKYKLKCGEEGVVRVSGTSFSSAILTAFGAIIKSIYPEINVYQLRYLLQKCQLDNDYEIFNKIVDLVIKYESNIPELKGADFYIKILNPKDFIISNKWRVELYSEDGVLCEKQLSIRVCIYSNRDRKKIIRNKKIFLEKGLVEFSFSDLDPGIYYMEVFNEELGISSMSMAINRPVEPSLIIDEKSENIAEIISNEELEVRVFYTYDNEIPIVAQDGQAMGATKEYVEKFIIKEGCKKINLCSFYNGVFSNLVSIDIEMLKARRD